MTGVTEGTLTLRLRYNAAYLAYQSCAQAVSEARVADEPPSVEFLGREVKALRELTKARANFLAALNNAPNGDPFY
jgi:hypothetical protein